MTSYRMLDTGEILSYPHQISAAAWEQLREPVRKALAGSIVPLPEPELGTLAARKPDVDGAILFDLQLHETPKTVVRCGVAWTGSGARVIRREVMHDNGSDPQALPYMPMAINSAAAISRDCGKVSDYAYDVAITILLHVYQHHKDAGSPPPPATECSVVLKMDEEGNSDS